MLTTPTSNKRGQTVEGASAVWRAEKRPRIDFEDTVHVLVGGENKSFHVPRKLISQRSSFFAAACSERWQQDGCKSISLPEDDPRLFSIYLNVLYRDEVTVCEESGADLPYLMTHISTYVLADKLGDIPSANLVMDSLVAVLQRPDRNANLKNGLLAHVYAHTVKGSPLRSLLVEYIASKASLEHCEIVLRSPDTPQDFVADVALRSLTKSTARMHQKGIFMARVGSTWHLKPTVVEIP